MRLLEAKDVSKRFGGLLALDRLSLGVEEGEIRAIIGPNGAGKTTFFNVATGFLKPTSGRIYFRGRDITSLSPNLIAKHGLVRTFQATVLFGGLTVFQNILVGSYLKREADFLSTLLNLPRSRKDNEKVTRTALEIMEYLGLEYLQHESAESLPHGLQRILGLGIALASKPQLLLLDEPVTGMNPNETTRMVELLFSIRAEKNITIVLVEHDMRVVMDLADRISVLNYGKKIAEGSPSDIRAAPEVITAYLGNEDDLLTAITH
jgi:branched-chain amino acid transport system ATP-binding protein